MKQLFNIITIGLFTLLFTTQLPAKNKHLIYTIDIKKEIDNTSWIYLRNGLSEALNLKASDIIIHMNTYGGLLEPADSMRTAILYSDIPIHAFIDNNAASAGALISIACKHIYMRPGANIGAATVVNQSGTALPDKYQSYMRSLIRSTAEYHGKDTVIKYDGDTIIKWKRDPMIAESMVDDRLVVPNLVDSGKVLTLTSQEAVKWGYCDGIANNIDQVITDFLGYKDYMIKNYKPSWMDNLKGFLMNPAIQSILIIFIIGGLYFELQTPGLGFPILAAITACVLYFMPLYMDGLAEYWEILIFITGIILLLIEIFVIPGFGIAGTCGLVFVLGGLTLSLLNNTSFDFQNTSNYEFGKATLIILLGLTFGFAMTIWLSNKIGNKGPLKRIALNSDLKESVSVPVLTNLIGESGITATVLRPSGKILIKGEIYDGISESGFIEKGKEIKVVRFENAQVYVTTK